VTGTTLNLTIMPTEARALIPHIGVDRSGGVRNYFLSLEITKAAATNERRVLTFGDRDEGIASFLRLVYLSALRSAHPLPKTRRRLTLQLHRLDRYLGTPLVDQIGALDE